MTAVPLTEAADRFTPAMAGLEVDRCSFDHQATLVVGVSEGPYHVVLEGPLVLTTAGEPSSSSTPRRGVRASRPSWLGSPDEARRFDAIALIRRLRIVAAVPALRALSAELARSDRPGAPFERDTVDALADELAGR